MILRHRVALDGVQLDEVDSRIIIQGIKTSGAKTSYSALSLAGRDGQRIAQHRRDSLDVVVEFALLIRKTDMAARSQLLEKVNSWAAQALYDNQGAWLTTNYKEDRRIRVYLMEAPEEGDLDEWTNVFSMTFRACGQPYWQESKGSSASTKTGSTQSLAMEAGGNAKTIANVTLENKSGQRVDTATITIGSCSMSFTGMGMEAWEALEIDHNWEGVLRIRIRNAAGTSRRSILGKRTAASADDFYVMPGNVACSFTAQRACVMTVNIRGRFL